MATKTRKRQEQIISQELSDRLQHDSDILAKKAAALSESYQKLSDAPGKGFDKDVASSMKSAVDNLGLNKNLEQISSSASERIADAKRTYEDQGFEAFKSIIDNHIRSAESELGTSDQIVDKLSDMIDDSKLVRKKLAKRLGSSIRDKLDFIGEKNTTIGSAINAISPEKLIGKITSELKELNSGGESIVHTYIAMKVEEFVLDHFSEVGRAINSGELDVAKSLLDKYSEKSNVEKELSNGGDKTTPISFQSDAKPAKRVITPDWQLDVNQPKHTQAKPKARAPNPHAAEKKEGREESPAVQENLEEKAPINAQTRSESDQDRQDNENTPPTRSKTPSEAHSTQTIKGRVSKSWVEQAQDYYSHFAQWAPTSQLQDEEIKDLFKKLEKDYSLQTATDLWKKINGIWLDKTDTIQYSDKARLRKAIENASSVEDARDVSREMLTHHINYYKYELALLLPSGKEVAEAIRKEEELRKKLRDASESERAEIALHLEIAKQESRKLFESDEKFSEARLGPDHKSVAFGKRKFTSKTFYELFNQMNEMHAQGNYSGNETIWAYMHNFAYSAWLKRLLPDEGITTPPPIETPTSQATKRSGISAPPPIPVTEEAFN